MTTRDLIQWAGQHPAVLLLAFVAPPVAARGWRAGCHGKEPGQTCRPGNIFTPCWFIWCACRACLPGVITAYTLFVSGENLLDANLLVYFLPIASMVATLVLIRKNVSFDDVPGFDRLSGLMVMVGCSFVIALVIQKTRIWVLSSAVRLRNCSCSRREFLPLLKWGTYMLFRRRDEPKQERPKFPGA